MADHLSFEPRKGGPGLSFGLVLLPELPFHFDFKRIQVITQNGASRGNPDQFAAFDQRAGIHCGVVVLPLQVLVHKDARNYRGHKIDVMR